jgi:monovalent cation:H+ antiporter-2, CPA2 family
MSEPFPQHESPPSHAIIAGFGIPGRMIAENLHRRGMSYCVIELNAATVERCAHRGVPIIVGDARDEHALRNAGIERATLVAVTLPDEPIALEAVTAIRRLNPTARIIVRCAYTSSGLDATRRGANDVVVAEQIVANEFSRLIDDRLS